ncbi:hypothetical protein LX32DRAFT_403985 [Colletotrichum zoysiae]|uniref:Uncharacterized protein n=1 Tax=Colletotrichum zoysiae TaxID=1216348 RepID=A0AAD9LZI8_9PEZI|nr:hypothetical protein LX32DRAFT_403985 [Colletotrichum zoysiae]
MHPVGPNTRRRPAGQLPYAMLLSGAWSSWFIAIFPRLTEFPPPGAAKASQSHSSRSNLSLTCLFPDNQLLWLTRSDGSYMSTVCSRHASSRLFANCWVLPPSLLGDQSAVPHD